MIIILTATPGSGKTLYLLNTLVKEKERPVYYHNVPLTDEGKRILKWIPLDNPKEFHKQIPDNAIVVIDEVQEIFPSRNPKVDVPEALKFLETHRHKGVDVYFITQHPSFMDIHIRRLAGRHLHMQRNFGFERSTIYDHNKCITDPNDRRCLTGAVKSVFTFTPDVYPLYKSAEVHTHKRRIPKKLYFLASLVFVLVGFLYMGYAALRDKGQGLDEMVESATDTVAGQPLQFHKANFVYSANNAKPVIEGIPSSAPMYSHLMKAKTFPRPNCITNHNRTICKCYTQQATRLSMKKKYCLNYVDNGYFDHTIDDRKISKRQSRKAGKGAAAARPASTTKKLPSNENEPTVTFMGVPNNNNSVFAGSHNSEPDYIGQYLDGDYYR